MRASILLTVVCLWTAVACSAQAGLILRVGQGGSTNGISEQFTAVAGTQLMLDVWLVQQGTYQLLNNEVRGDYRLSDDGTDHTGLGSYVLDAQSNSSLLSTSVQSYGTGFLEDPALATLEPVNNTRRFGGLAVDDLNSPTLQPVHATAPHSTSSSPNTGSIASNSILLATLLVDISDSALGNYALQIFSPFESNEASSSLLFFGLGSDIFAPEIVVPSAAMANITVVATPEPSSLALLGLASIAIAKKRRRLVQAFRQALRSRRPVSIT